MFLEDVRLDNNVPALGRAFLPHHALAGRGRHLERESKHVHLGLSACEGPDSLKGTLINSQRSALQISPMYRFGD